MKVLVTGAGGEVGYGLIRKLSESSDLEITALDIKKPEGGVEKSVAEYVVGDVLDFGLLENVFSKTDFDIVFHLASVLSTAAEKNPHTANLVNSIGTSNLLENSAISAKRMDKVIKFIFPSSIAVYGVNEKTEKVFEDECLAPITMYGINKLYGEMLGRYYSKHYKLLENGDKRIDFRSLRFPGLISSDTLPSGGTSDYAPEMIHAAVKGQNYTSFVRPDTTISFMAMPDAIAALLLLADTPDGSLTRQVYNVEGFSVYASQIEEELKKTFPDFVVSYEVDQKRQKIVDSWPKSVDDTAAQTDWAWKPQFGFNETLYNYLIPSIESKLKHDSN